MNLSQKAALLPAFYILVLSSIFHLLLCPYTKVEESFTLHAVWDILTHGWNISSYDHWEFPGAVKRSFIPPFILACLTYPFSLVRGVNIQFTIRFTLMAVSQLCFQSLARKVTKLYGVAAGNFFLLFTATQFHLQFYVSRTLPNFLALPVVIIGLSQLLASDIPTTADVKAPMRRLRSGIGLLIATGIIARSEVGVLCGVIILVDILLSPLRHRYILAILPTVLVSGIVSTAATVAVDTHLWNSPSFPELEALLFNVVDGHASNWGIHPWYYYLLSLPKLLLNPLILPLIFSTIILTWYTSISAFETLRKLRYILIVPIAYIAGFSILSHKEWRFIVYVIPLLTVTSSISAAYIYHHRQKSLFYKLTYILLLLSLPATLSASVFMGIVSSTNYPGAQALRALHAISNSSGSRVYLDIPARMMGATLPLCSRPGWIYCKSENATVLHSTEYWREVDYAIIGSLADVPCNRGKGVEGKGEWDVIFKQQGYAGIQWRNVEIPECVWDNTYVQKVMEIGFVRKVVTKVEQLVEKKGGLKIPWMKLEDKIYVLKHLRNDDFIARSMMLEEKKEQERRGLGECGEVAGDWREFY